MNNVLVVALKAVDVTRVNTVLELMIAIVNEMIVANKNVIIIIAIMFVIASNNFVILKTSFFIKNL